MTARNGHGPVRVASKDIHRIPDDEARIARVMDDVGRREGIVFHKRPDGGVDGERFHGVTPAGLLMDKERAACEEADVDSVILFERTQARAAALNGVIELLTADGPHPADIVRRAYCLILARRPDRLGKMTQKDVADMLGETRATHSARMKRIFSKKPAATRFGKGYKAPGQKSAEACESYRASALGNTNRRGTGKRPPLVRPDGTKTGIHYDNY